MKRIISIFIVATLLATTTAAQEFRYSKPPKDESTATFLSIFIPGGGHFYAEEHSRGLTLLLTGGGAMATGMVLGAVFPREKNMGFGVTAEEYNWTYFLLGFAVYAGTWIYGIVDAPNAVRRYNERHGFSSGHIDLQPYVIHNDFAGYEYGLRFSLNL